MDSIWFYTFSTSAQVLAALAGLFAVFVVYKVQSMSSVFDDMKGAVINLVSHYIQLPQYKSHRKATFEESVFWTDEEILEQFKLLLDKRNQLPQDERGAYHVGRSPVLVFAYDLDEKTYMVYKGLVDKNKQIIKDLYLILVTSMLAIGLAMFCLSFKNFIQTPEYWITANFIFVIVVLFLITFKTISISRK